MGTWPEAKGKKKLKREEVEQETGDPKKKVGWGSIIDFCEGLYTFTPAPGGHSSMAVGDERG